jgi:hypothetical protein
MLKTQDKYGPGIWFMLHLTAAHATTQPLKESFISNVSVLGENFPCENCRHHFAAYVKEHPLAQYVAIDRGLFRWTWEFHESVNKRLGKQHVSFEDAWKQFNASSAICTEDCGDASPTLDTPKKTYTIKSYRSFIDGGK